MIGVNVTSGKDLDPVTISNMAAFISFPSSYESSLPDNVEYHIYTQEFVSKF